MFADYEAYVKCQEKVSQLYMVSILLRLTKETSLLWLIKIFLSFYKILSNRAPLTHKKEK